ncbi:phage holin family protein [Candidatus Parcubacteria bacterium]|nr:phage holin family protein [Candidatus Parcubacteria bacterium]
MKIIIRLVVSALAVAIAVKLLPGVHVSGGVQTYVILAVVLAAINMFVKPILTLLTLPLSIMTLGLFTIVINALLILLADRLVEGFSVDSFLWALAFGLVLSIVHAVLHRLEK